MRHLSSALDMKLIKKSLKKFPTRVIVSIGSSHCFAPKYCSKTVPDGFFRISKKAIYTIAFLQLFPDLETGNKSLRIWLLSRINQ
jgi:hypothetical protein